MRSSRMWSGRVSLASVRSRQRRLDARAPTATGTPDGAVHPGGKEPGRHVAGLPA